MYDHNKEYHISRMAGTLTASRSGYYAWVDRGCASLRELHDATDLEILKAAFIETRETYGPGRLSKHLKAKGIYIGKSRIRRLMRENNMVPKTVRKFKATTNSNHDYPVAPNLLNRNFKVDGKNQAWVCDITYVATDEGWLYVAAVMDLCHGKIVGWSMDKTMTAKLTCNALKQALLRAKPSRGLLCHSDRGVQYASREYRSLLKRHGIVQSMSRKGNCWDNAPMESFFGTLKSELIYHEDYKTRAQARASIFDYVESFYNRVRLQERLGYLSPENYELLRLSA